MRAENEMRKKRVAARRAPCVQKQKKKKSHQERRRFRKEMQHVQKHNRQRGCREESTATMRLRTRSGCRAATDADHRSSETREETRNRKRAPQKAHLKEVSLAAHLRVGGGAAKEPLLRRRHTQTKSKSAGKARWKNPPTNHLEGPHTPVYGTTHK